MQYSSTLSSHAQSVCNLWVLLFLLPTAIVFWNSLCPVSFSPARSTQPGSLESPWELCPWTHSYSLSEPRGRSPSRAGAAYRSSKKCTTQKRLLIGSLVAMFQSVCCSAKCPDVSVFCLLSSNLPVIKMDWSQAWWNMPLIPGIRRQRQSDHYFN